MPDPTFTLGIEEEFQIVDPQTRELRPRTRYVYPEAPQVPKDLRLSSDGATSNQIADRPEILRFAQDKLH